MRNRTSLIIMSLVALALLLGVGIHYVYAPRQIIRRAVTGLGSASISSSRRSWSWDYDTVTLAGAFRGCQSGADNCEGWKLRCPAQSCQLAEVPLIYAHETLSVGELVIPSNGASLKESIQHLASEPSTKCQLATFDKGRYTAMCLDNSGKFLMYTSKP